MARNSYLSVDRRHAIFSESPLTVETLALTLATSQHETTRLPLFPVPCQGPGEGLAGGLEIAAMDYYPHSPGPWFVPRESDVFDDTTPIYCGEKPAMMVVACAWPINGEGESGSESPTCQANARLIAAAPELLEALQMAEATIERLTERHGPFSSTDGTQSVIRAAIAKAVQS